ncbi:MAG: Hsp20/alpha crystallin family protein [Candidatus Kapaibacterium sp.]
MSYYRFDPVRGLESFMNQIRNVSEEINQGIHVETSAFKPRIDITESRNEFTVYAELPGMDKSAIKIYVNEDKILNISGNLNREIAEGRTLHINERKYGEFSRSLQLPEEANIDKIEANHSNGVLILSIPKKEPEQPKVINVMVN